MIPHGDRSNFTESGRAEGQDEASTKGRNYIMCILVLFDGFNEERRRRLPTSPDDELLQGSPTGQFLFERGMGFRCKICPIDDSHA
jgi:hypothetical protein